jgi:hypothetical protein
MLYLCKNSRMTPEFEYFCVFESKLEINYVEVVSGTHMGPNDGKYPNVVLLSLLVVEHKKRCHELLFLPAGDAPRPHELQADPEPEHAQPGRWLWLRFRHLRY